MQSVKTQDGRVTFSLVPEDNHAARIVLPNGTELKMPALDLLEMLNFYNAHLEDIIISAETQIR